MSKEKYYQYRIYGNISYKHRRYDQKSNLNYSKKSEMSLIEKINYMHEVILVTKTKIEERHPNDGAAQPVLVV